jgi:two-component system nitrogen regulation sensor histidine kinase NtrY
MGFRRALRNAAPPFGLFGAGIAAALSWTHGLYATAAFAGVIAAGVGALVFMKLHAPPAKPIVPARERFKDGQEHGALRAFLDEAPAPLLLMSSDGAVRVINRAARSLFGVDDRVPSPPAALTEATRRLVPGERATIALTVEGRMRTFALSVADVEDQRLAVLVDVQAEMLAAEAAALRELLQVLGHEIMNSLTPVASLAETARELVLEGASLDLAQDALETLARRTRGLERFVSAYRQLARLPSPTIKTVKLGELTADVAALFEGQWKASGVRFEATTTGDELVRTDPDLLTQALLGLLANGAEAALASGQASPTVTLRANRTPVALEFKVEDSGAGVPTQHRDRIFRPFFTTKPEGTGVGLSLARQIVSSLGGELLLCDTSSGAGAAFVIRL